ncbi:MBOAT family O-acyltransferase [Desulfobacca acetoxidans]|uniref:Membrane bound O-acyl transferase MBOAT family protein n=1 Tax=Desulfobacca acetoxidans (strain ATCC 700848 / DSM 11109 / ASRB2) TaxID=880072 RepID=F2NI70_DESAR|nr:MBOAT family O-acyltransferase [Desulfobacca acetoxidans]AEB09839.1 membrane bound O-acyl transferase MBOAT family protein [Desulfobacca acetoxidans DSM 11109]
MSFISWQFPLFLIGFILIYWRLPHRQRLWFLLVGSYAFYAFWDVRFLALVFTTTVVDFLCGLGIQGERRSLRVIVLLSLLPFAWLLGCFGFIPRSGIDLNLLTIALGISLAFLGVYLLIWHLPDSLRPRGFLLLSICLCLSILGYFKYCNFFSESAKSALSFLGLRPDWPTWYIILPVGISFYTFQSLAYVIDLYRGQAVVCRDFLIFAVFDAFFPQLVAGPIERSRHLIPQLEKDIIFVGNYLNDGLRLILIGLFKKVFVADNCALLANYVFAPQTALNGAWALIGGVAFAFQIYGDFSGYTDIARGTAKMLGIDLVQNFRYPYLAKDPSDFWSRWHISLSTWFRDYVYIPLGGNRGRDWQTVRNLMVTMLLAGLWHGASWVFVLWGAYHGVLLTLYRFSPLRVLNRKQFAWLWQDWLARLLMFGFTLIGWAIFRSPDLTRFWTWLMALGNWGPAELPWLSSLGWLLLHLVPLMLLQIAASRFEDETKLVHLHWATRGVLYFVMILLIVSSTEHDQEFIYFQF